MELGPRDRLSQAFWHEQKKGRTIGTPHGDVVHLDIRHLGEKKIDERLPLVRELARRYMSVDPVFEPIPVRPVVHYFMGGIHTDIDAATPVDGLFAAGECACVSINGANRLGSNSLTETLVFGGLAGRNAVAYIQAGDRDAVLPAIEKQAQDAWKRVAALFDKTDGRETVSSLRKEMNDAMEAGAGIYRSEDSLETACETIGTLRERYADVQLEDKSNVFNTDLIQTLELGAMLDVAHALAHSALARGESRGAHQRLDKTERDDGAYLKHTLAHHAGPGDPRIDYLDVVITKSQPGERVYGGEQP